MTSEDPEPSERPYPGPTVGRLPPDRLAQLAATAFGRADQAQRTLLGAAADKGGDRAVVETALMTLPPILHAQDLLHR
ncbi:hypothetical protein [Streptacidiphilus sp. P02-A3a]|uniref:hypothetical protein n=1 Tax=Streptacidiphilus sp. P02-A3a TaxID=2704468 RepID=UPI0015FD52A5|nr:hypothetical protein [Streptacidiphilus sp. P02-A3a]QMU71428.1 hypothetical protein GXP74_27540 [Streptacidiphilus sp. P02-A3a]